MWVMDDFQLTLEHNKAKDEITALRARLDKLYGALEYATPIVKRYGHTQGSSTIYHTELLEPLQTALNEERAHREREASDD